MYGYIYKTTNLVNGKIYVGKKKGEFTHSYKGSGKYLKNAISKYGNENFTVDMIEYCDTLEYQNEREKYWIKYYRDLGTPMYNISSGGDGGDVYSMLSNDDKFKVSEKLRKSCYFSTLSAEEITLMRKRAWETRRKNGNDKFSDEYRKKISEAHKGIKPSKEAIAKGLVTKKLHRYRPSEETKRKISEGNKGKVVSDETRRKISEAGKLRVGDKNSFYGKHHTDETKQKISEYSKLGICGMKGRHLTDEQKKHHSESMIGKNANTKWMNDGVSCIKVKSAEVQKYLDMGYKFGRKIEGVTFTAWNKGKTAETDVRVSKYVNTRIEKSKQVDEGEK